MQAPVVVVGLGEMGSVFARGFLRCDHPVYPVTRQSSMAALAGEIPEPPELVLIAVGENDLPQQLAQVPEPWRDRLVLLQNELLPHVWQAYGLEPTVISVWFEKKKGMDSKQIIPSPVYGRHADQVAQALASIGLDARKLESPQALLDELVIKNVYILTTNIAGLRVGGNVGELWDAHRDFATDVAGEVIRLQEALTGRQFDPQRLIDGMVAAFEGDRAHMCMGRSAPARLQRALAQAAEHGLTLPVLQGIAEEKGL